MFLIPSPNINFRGLTVQTITVDPCVQFNSSPPVIKWLCLLYFSVFCLIICSETDRRGFCTPASTKPVSRAQTKSTIKKTRFVTPSNQKSSTVQPISVLKSKRKSAVKCEAMTSNEIDAGKDTLQEDNGKSYKDKSLDMR